MGTIAIITLILAVPPALVASFTLFKKAKGREDGTDFAVPEGVAAQCVNKLTCVYAPKALLVFSPFSYNYQIAKPVGILPGNLYRRIIDNTNEESNDETDIGLPQYISDLRD